MPNNREKGKRIEREMATALRPIFPDIRRNAGTQSQAGGVDLENTPGFNFEIKGGKAYKSKMIRSILDQIAQEGRKEYWDVALVHPDREKPYALIPLEDFIEILQVMKAEGIL